MLQTSLIEEIASMENPDPTSNPNAEILVKIMAISDNKQIDVSHFPNSLHATVMTRKGALFSVPLNALTMLRKQTLQSFFLKGRDIDENSYNVE